jgi:hypothetical protein
LKVATIAIAANKAAITRGLMTLQSLVIAISSPDDDLTNFTLALDKRL